MKLLQAILVFGLIGFLCADLAVNIENNKVMKRIEEAKASENLDQAILQNLNQINGIGIQQRSILMQRILGLEHVHGLHKSGQKIQMCPLCNTPQPPPSPNRDLVTRLEEQERIFRKQ